MKSVVANNKRNICQFHNYNLIKPLLISMIMYITQLIFVLTLSLFV